MAKTRLQTINHIGEKVVLGWSYWCRPVNRRVWGVCMNPPWKPRRTIKSRDFGSIIRDKT